MVTKDLIHIFTSLRQEIKLVHLKDEAIIIIKDIDTKVETSIPKAKKSDYKKLEKLFQKFNDKIYLRQVEAEQWLAKETANGK
jgi:hypothetical protein